MPTPTTSILKSSGNRTPAPTSKVLRWKDLEAATAEAARTRRVVDIATSSVRSVRSVDGTEDEEGEREEGTEESEGEGRRRGYVREEVEEMFV